MLKNTAVVYAIAIFDLMGQAKALAATTLPRSPFT